MEKQEEHFADCWRKQKEVQSWFSPCKGIQSKYVKIIELGKALPPLPLEARRPENAVSGCQSTLYLANSFCDNLIWFAAESDALISSGLAALLIAVYSGELPEVVLQCPPTYLEELQIGASLTASRANGLYSIHLRMKQDALKRLINPLGRLDKREGFHG